MAGHVRPNLQIGMSDKYIITLTSKLTLDRMFNATNAEPTDNFNSIA